MGSAQQSMHIGLYLAPAQLSMDLPGHLQRRLDGSHAGLDRPAGRQGLLLGRLKQGRTCRAQFQARVHQPIQRRQYPPIVPSCATRKAEGPLFGPAPLVDHLVFLYRLRIQFPTLPISFG